MQLSNKIIIFLFFILCFSNIASAQEDNEMLPPPSVLAESDTWECSLPLTKFLIIEVSVLSKDNFVTNLEVDDFEVYYKKKKQMITHFAKGKIVASSDKDSEFADIADSNSRYVIGIVADNCCLENFLETNREKTDIKIKLSAEQTKQGKVKVEIHNFAYRQ